MIRCEKKNNGGLITAKFNNETSKVEWLLSNTEGKTITLIVKEPVGNVSVSNSIIKNLVERYDPKVFVLETNNKLFKKNEWSSSLSLFSETNKQIVYTNLIKNVSVLKCMFITEIMNNFDLMEITKKDIKQYDREGVLITIRSNTKPIEFITIKEESDYNIKNCCVKATQDILNAAKKNLPHTQGFYQEFSDIVEKIENNQQGGNISFDQKQSFLRETVLFLCVPAISILGESNQFSKSIMIEFFENVKKYTKESKMMIETYRYMLNKL